MIAPDMKLFSVSSVTASMSKTSAQSLPWCAALFCLPK